MPAKLQSDDHTSNTNNHKSTADKMEYVLSDLKRLKVSPKRTSDTSGHLNKQQYNKQKGEKLMDIYKRTNFKYNKPNTIH